MAIIKYFRKSFTLNADGSRTDHNIEESHNWPLPTCLRFKADFPSQVISITQEAVVREFGGDQTEEKGRGYQPRQSWKKRDNKPIPLIAPPPAAVIDMSGAASINAAVRAL